MPEYSSFYGMKPPSDYRWEIGMPIPELPLGQHEKLQDVPSWQEDFYIPPGATIWWDPIIRFLKFASMFRWPDGFNQGERCTFDGWQLADILIPLHGTYWAQDAVDLALEKGSHEYEVPIVGTRTYNSVGLLIARGAGKSAWASVEALVECIDPVYANSNTGLYALDGEQAMIMFEPIVQMIKNAPPEIQERLQIKTTAKEITSRVDNSLISVHTGSAKKEVGRKHTTAFVDEILSQPNAKLYNAIVTGLGKRLNTRLAWMTTPSEDDDPELFARLEVERAEAIAEDRALDHNMLPIIYKAHKNDDPFAWETLEKANPHLKCGRLDVQRLKKEMEDAKKYPSKRPAWSVFRLCLWQGSADSFIPINSWDMCAGELPPLEELASEEYKCAIGLDLSRTIDLTSMAIWWWKPDPGRTEPGGPLFDGPMYLTWAHFMSQLMYERIESWTGELGNWIEEGLVKVSIVGNEQIDYQEVHSYLFKTANRFNAIVGLDQYDAFSTRAIGEKLGIDMLPLRQGSGLAHGIKLLETQIIDENIVHNGDPLARWSMSKAEVRINAEGRISLVRPTRKSSDRIIDPVAAAVMAGDRIIYLMDQHYGALGYDSSNLANEANSEEQINMQFEIERVLREANRVVEEAIR